MDEPLSDRRGTRLRLAYTALATKEQELLARTATGQAAPQDVAALQRITLARERCSAELIDLERCQFTTEMRAARAELARALAELRKRHPLPDIPS